MRYKLGQVLQIRATVTNWTITATNPKSWNRRHILPTRPPSQFYG